MRMPAARSTSIGACALLSGRNEDEYLGRKKKEERCTYKPHNELAPQLPDHSLIRPRTARPSRTPPPHNAPPAPPYPFPLCSASSSAFSTLGSAYIP